MGNPSKTEKLPALIFASKAAALKIAALTVLDRLIVALHRGGAGPITIVTGEPVPELKRTKALGILFAVTANVPHVAGPVLVAQANLLVHAADVRRCLAAGARLTGPKRNGIQELLPLTVVPDDESRAATLLRQNSGLHVSNFPLELFFSPREPMIEASAFARTVDDPTAARNAERELWASLTSSSDGFVDRRFNRPLGRFLSKILIYTPVSPNAVSITSIIIGVIAALFFAEGSYKSALIGALLFQLSAIVDCVDGDLARILFKESPLGKWIDFWGDQIVHVSVFAGIAFGVLRNGGGKETVWLGISAIIGALIACVVVLRGMRKAAGSSGALQKLIDAATNRDFSVLVLALAIAQKLPWFLWLAGLGSHFFWLTALALQLTHKPSAQTR